LLDPRRCDAHRLGEIVERPEPALDIAAGVVISVHGHLPLKRPTDSESEPMDASAIAE
jgi:hypothetical protein